MINPQALRDEYRNKSSDIAIAGIAAALPSCFSGFFPAIAKLADRQSPNVEYKSLDFRRVHQLFIYLPTAEKIEVIPFLISFRSRLSASPLLSISTLTGMIFFPLLSDEDAGRFDSGEVLCIDCQFEPTIVFSE